ncbi:unnamed protein product [Paramecium octaurelia]|uniref:Tetratricopeptide repeat protein n=1 Tax=Paramecium octaurelia TaxID=43137 RepID=A0A8S1UA30_PAROT|nr:unnamed protein product [Paramecium octaurelia]
MNITTDSCQKTHHQNNRIIGFCLRCKDNYLSCKSCFAEFHYQHNEDFLLIDNILLVVDQVLQKMRQAIEQLKTHNLFDVGTFINSKYSQLKEIVTQLMNQNNQINRLHIQMFNNNIQDNTLNEILCQLIVQSSCFSEQQLENIKQIFIQSFQQVQLDNQIREMLDRCYLLCSIQKYPEAHKLSQVLLKLTSKKYFLKTYLSQFDSITNKEIWNLECLFGRNLYLLKKYDLSIDFFKKLLQQNQNEHILAESYIYLSLNLIQTKKYAEALNELAVYRTLNPRNILINFFEGFALERMNEIQDAVWKYQELALTTNDLLYNLAYGKILLQAEFFNQAEEVFERIIQNNNQNEIAQIYKCLTLLKGQKFPKALKQSQILIESKQKSVYGYVLKGIILKMQKKNQEVNIISNQLNLSFPDNRWNYLFQGIILIQDSNFWDANGYLQKIIDDKYIEENVKRIQVRSLLQVKKVPEAFEILNKIQSCKGYDAMLNDTFYMLKQIGMTSQGAILFKRLYQKKKEDSEAVHFEGQCYYNDVQYDKALQCFNKAIDANPKQSKSFYYKGQIQFRTFQFEQAIESYLNAGKTSQKYNNHFISFHKGNLYLFLFQFEKALEAYNFAIEQDNQIETTNERRQITLTMKAIIHWYKKEAQNALNLVDRNLQTSTFMLSRLYKELNYDYQADYNLNLFKQNNPADSYNFQKQNYDHGQMFIKYMEKNSLQFEQLDDREYEIMKYAAWVLDYYAYDIEFGYKDWDYNKVFYLTIQNEQDEKLIREQLKRQEKYPII